MERKMLLGILVIFGSGLIGELFSASYLYGRGFSPAFNRGYGNAGFGYPYSPYGYGYGMGNSIPMGAPMGVGYGYGGYGYGRGELGLGGFYAGAVGPSMNDYTVRTSAYGLGYGFPLYG